MSLPSHRTFSGSTAGGCRVREWCSGVVLKKSGCKLLLSDFVYKLGIQLGAQIFAMCAPQLFKTPSVVCLLVFVAVTFLSSNHRLVAGYRGLHPSRFCFSHRILPSLCLQGSKLAKKCGAKKKNGPKTKHLWLACFARVCAKSFFVLFFIQLIIFFLIFGEYFWLCSFAYVF